MLKGASDQIGSFREWLAWMVHSQNVQLHNVELQNVQLQNVQLQNVQLQNVELQNVQVTKRPVYKMSRLQHVQGTKRPVFVNLKTCLKNIFHKIRQKLHTLCGPCIETCKERSCG